MIPATELAIALYQRNGFIVAEELGDLLADGVTRERVMVKALRSTSHDGGSFRLLVSAVSFWVREVLIDSGTSAAPSPGPASTRS